MTAQDKLWLVLREDWIPAPVLHEFACRCAERALALVDTPDPRSVEAIATKRAWLRGEATDDELAAAQDAALAAAQDAVLAAVQAAAWGCRQGRAGRRLGRQGRRQVRRMGRRAGCRVGRLGRRLGRRLGHRLGRCQGRTG